MNTSDIGNIGEAKTLLKFVEKGVQVFMPFGNNSRADFIAEFNGRLNKIQVKTSTREVNEILHFATKSVSNGVGHDYSKDEIDYFCFYHLERDILLIFSMEENLPKTEIKFRLNKDNVTKNQYKARYVEDYLFDVFKFE